MAKIIFSTVSGLPNAKKLPCFYEGWVNALAREGNEVLVIITNNLMSNIWSSNASKSNLDKSALDKFIINFAPDLVITCNNSLYENMPKLASCPIIIYASDSPAVFSDRDILRKNLGRYDVMVAGIDSLPMVEEYFGPNAKSLNLMNFATDFIAQDLPQDKNISFIGTNFSFAANPFKKIFKDGFDEDDKQNFKLFLESFRSDVLLKPEAHLKKLGLNSSLLKKISHIDLLNLLSSNTRIQTLQAIADLGLSLYGSKNWIDVCDSSVDLALSLINKEVSSIKENQDIYNSSKISINISHAQAGRAFSWRVRDIMACNSALVSDPREDLVTQFGKYVKIPTYENPYEARQICQKLLQDEIWRKEIVAGSQLAIEEGHRFRHRIKDMQEIIGINLMLGKVGSVQFLDSNDFLKKCSYKECSVKISKDIFLPKNGFIRSSNRKRIKITRKIKVNSRNILSKLAYFS